MFKLKPKESIFQKINSRSKRRFREKLMTKIPHVGKYEFKLVAMKNQQDHLLIPTKTRKISKTYQPPKTILLVI